MPETMYSLSIVIPNYNGQKLLEKNLPTVYQAVKSSGIKDYEIIISDDASSDSSVQFIRQSYPNIILLENKINKGFAGNTNRGIRVAKKDLVLVLNSDIQLSETYFLPLMPYFAQSDTFGVMGKIIDAGLQKAPVGAKYPGYRFGKIIPGKNYGANASSPLPTYYLSGANALVNRQKLLQLMGFNELFNPYYYEDVDLGLRAWRLGFKLYFDNRAVCYHTGSATICREEKGKVKTIYKRNKFYLHYLHLNKIELRYYLIKLNLKVLVRILVRDKNYRYAFRQFKAAKKDLKRVKSSYKTLQKGHTESYSLKEVTRKIKTIIATHKLSS